MPSDTDAKEDAGQTLDERDKGCPLGGEVMRGRKRKRPKPRPKGA